MAPAPKPTRYPSDPTGAWIPISGRRPGSTRDVQLGQWVAVRGRRPGSKSYRAGRDARGRFARISLGPEAHYEWSQDPALTYWSGGIYRIDGRRVERSQAAEVIRASVVRLPPEARWRFYAGPNRVEYLGPDRWRGNGKRINIVQAAYRLGENLVAIGLDLLGWNFLSADPTYDEVREGVADHAFEIGTADIALPEIKDRYQRMPGGQSSSDLDEERDVPFEKVSEDVLAEMRKAWVLFETGVFDKTPFGRWLAAAKGIPSMISYYVVAHRVVYVEQEAVTWGEVIQTRFVPFGRGDGYQELAARVQDMIDKSDEEVTFVAGGVKVLFQELLT